MRTRASSTSTAASSAQRAGAWSCRYAPGGRSAGRQRFFGGGGGGGAAGKGGWRRNGAADGRDNGGDNLLKEGWQYDRNARAEYYIAPSFAQRGGYGGAGSGAAALIDADEVEYLGRGGREERARRARADGEREREVAKKLSAAGNGAGAEYLRMREDGAAAMEKRDEGDRGGGAAVSTRHGEREDRKGADAARAIAAGRVGAGEMRISPLKRKGGGTLEGEGGARKKTRFVTAKVIRVAVWESLGVVVGGRDEDDLVIV